MVYGNANLDSDYVAWAALDKPMLVGRNWLRTTGAEGRWRTTTGAWGADESTAAAPATWCYDEHDHNKAYATANNDVYYVINLGAAVGEIDSVFLLNTSGVIGDTVTVEFCTAQDGLFTPFQTAETVTGTAKRMAFVDLDHGATGTQQLYSDVQYLRIHFNGVAILPKVGEIIIGQRRQLEHNPKLPYDPRNLRSSTRRFESDTAVIKDHVFYKGRQKISATIWTKEDARVDDLETFFETEIDYGTLPFLWLAAPDTTPSDALWLKYDNPELINPKLGFAKRELQLVASECGPNFLSAGV